MPPLKAPHPDDLNINDRIRDPGGIVWIVQGVDKKTGEIGIKQEGVQPGVYKIINRFTLLGGWYFLRERSNEPNLRDIVDKPVAKRSIRRRGNLRNRNKRKPKDDPPHSPELW